jgi:hypothetical protein
VSNELTPVSSLDIFAMSSQHKVDRKKKGTIRQQATDVSITQGSQFKKVLGP